MHFVCSKCKGIIEGTMDSIRKLCDEVETGNEFCYLGDRLNSRGGCEAAVTARVRISSYGVAVGCFLNYLRDGVVVRSSAL